MHANSSRAAASALSLAALALCLSAPARAQSKTNPMDKFRQLEEILPTPNE